MAMNFTLVCNCEKIELSVSAETEREFAGVARTVQELMEMAMENYKLRNVKSNT